MMSHWIAGRRLPFFALWVSLFALSGCQIPDELFLPAADPGATAQLTIGEFDTDIRAGDYANVAVSYADLDTAAYALRVRITDGVRDVSEIRRNANARAGNFTLKMPIEWSAPAGSNYYVVLSTAPTADAASTARTVEVNRKDKLIKLTVPVPAPVVSITAIPNQVRAGDMLRLQLSQSNINFTTHTLTVFLAKGGEHAVTLTLPATTPAQSEIRLALPADTALGPNYVVGWDVSRVLGGPADLRMISGEYINSLVTVTAPLVTTPPVVLSGISTNVTAGEYLTATLTQQNVDFDKYNLIVYLTNGAGFYEQVDLVPAGNGPRQIKLPVGWTTAGADGFMLGWSLEPKNPASGLFASSQEMSANPVRVVSATGIPTIKVTPSSYPVLMNAGDFVNVGIDYANVNFSTHKVYVGVRRPVTSGIIPDPVGMVDLTQGSSTAIVTVKVPVWWDAPIGNGYIIEVAIVDTVRDQWDDPKTLLVPAAASGISIKADPPMPLISFANVPATVRAGEYLNVGLNHAGINFTTHELVVMVLNSDLPPFEVAVPAANGDGAVTVKLPIQWATPVGTDFQVEWSLISKIPDELRSISKIREIPVIVTAASATPPTLAAVSFDAIVNAGGVANATVSYSGVNFATHDLFVALVKGDGYIAGMQQIITPVSGSKSVQMTVANVAPGGVYDVVVAALPRTNKSVSERVSDPLAAIVRGSTKVEVKSNVVLPTAQVTFTTTNVKAGDYLSGSVSYQNVNSATQTPTHQLVVYIVNIAGDYFEVPVAATGSGTASFKLPVSWEATVSNNYTAGWAALSLSGGWNSPHSTSGEILNTKIAVQTPTSPAPMLQVNSYAKTIKAGLAGTISVYYKDVNFSTHNLHIDLANGNNVFGRVTYGAANGLPSEGTKNFVVEVDAIATPGANYYFDVSVVKVTGGKDDWSHPMSVSTDTGASSVTITP